MNYAGLIHGLEEHYLDHLAPLCHLLKIPLIITDPQLYKLSRLFYPKTEILLFDEQELGEKLVRQFDLIICCTPRVLFDEAFYFAQFNLQKRVHTLWCPHGNSDKGWHAPFMESLKEEAGLLIYGKQMERFLQLKQVLPSLPHTFVGNYRLEFYLRHQKYYDHLTDELISPLNSYDKILLYAPTWQDYEKSCTLASMGDILISQLPENWALIIKPHPNLFKQAPQLINKIKHEIANKKSLLLIDQFPSIYPLLKRIDAYIGDMSSIGYDFLAFNRPMFFLNEQNRDPKNDPSLFLAQCGQVIDQKNYPHIYEIIASYSDTPGMKDLREKIYKKTFAPKISQQKWRQGINTLCKQLVSQTYVR